MHPRRDCDFRRKKAASGHSLIGRATTQLCRFLLGLMLISGVALSQSPSSGLDISPQKLTFPATPLGSQSLPEVITVSNPGASSITLNEIITSGIDFVETTDCEKALNAGAKCSIQIVFRPAISGSRFGDLEIAAGDDKVPHFVALDGTAQ